MTDQIPPPFKDGGHHNTTPHGSPSVHHAPEALKVLTEEFADVAHLPGAGYNAPRHMAERGLKAMDLAGLAVVTAEPDDMPTRIERALTMLDAAEALAGTNSAVEIGGFRIEECDNQGETATTRNLHTAGREAERLETENKRLKDAAPNVEEDQRVKAWYQIADHPAFRSCYEEERPLIEAVVDKITALEAENQRLTRACQQKNGDCERYAKAAAKAEKDARDLERQRNDASARERNWAAQMERTEQQHENVSIQLSGARVEVARLREALTEIRGAALGEDPKDRRMALLVIWALAGQALEGGSDE
ncbi:hypothetical protein SAMN05428985_11069 [Nocardioides sp. YR527]|uniref:hypothetical protein n=1 Tax=Nocardioides sp. YR527 TaxID=1881028 RepID=UPI00088F1DE7|nr:hypothetical protein [Nocardioides sp. YR527]SDL15055.1 hypothetical protein SAMN05428985_11069 [Nocardioides sp. YR527]